MSTLTHEDDELVMVSLRMTRRQARCLGIVCAITGKKKAVIFREAVQEHTHAILSRLEQYERVVPLIHADTPDTFAVLPKDGGGWRIITDRVLGSIVSPTKAG